MIAIVLLLLACCCAVAVEVFVSEASNADSLPPSQIAGLQWLYNSTSGPNWKWDDENPERGYRWNFSASPVNPCQQQHHWQGVTCTTDCSVSPTIDCNVLGLSLTNFGLNGTLPAEIDLLPELQVLDLRYNTRLTGTLPTSIASLPQLLELELEECGFHGTIPTEFGQMTTLRTLNLCINRLTGTLPSQLGQLWQVYKFWVHENRLGGTLPPALGNLTNMTTFSLGGNPFGNGSIPFPTFIIERNWSQLQLFAMGGVGLTGSLPRELATFQNLDTLFLAYNSLTGPVPSELFQLPRLKIFVAGHNFFTGTIPANAFSVSNKMLFNVAANYITGSLPAVSEFSNIAMIDTSHNFLTGWIPSSIGAPLR